MFANEEEIQGIATQQDSFILDCYLYVLDVPHIVVGPPCRDRVKISKIVTADMLNCFTIKLPSPSLKTTVVGGGFYNISGQPANTATTGSSVQSCGRFRLFRR